jgi:hypothetical protein
MRDLTWKTRVAHIIQLTVAPLEDSFLRPEGRRRKKHKIVGTKLRSH